MSKKERFNQKGKNNNNVFLFAGVAIVLIIAAAAYITSGGGSATVDSGLQVKEVTITPTVVGDKIIIKKSEVLENKIVKFEYEPIKITLKSGAQIPFPLMAYVTPSGEIRVAIRMCEPCNGLTFSAIGGKILHCDTCGTQWDLETNKWNEVGAAICGSYAPEIIEDITINGDEIEIKTNGFKDWQPRA